MFSPIRTLSIAFALTVSGCASDGDPMLDGTDSALSVFTDGSLRETGSDWGLNAYRSRNGLPGVVQSSRLDRAARMHAVDLSRSRRRGHVGSDGSTHTQRIRRQGCRGGAENVAWGTGDPERAMAMWIESPGHRRNMLLPAVTHYGLAATEDRVVMVLSRNCP